jgi:hypothetical protein
MRKKSIEMRIDKLAAHRQRKQVKERAQRHAQRIVDFMQGKGHIRGETAPVEEAFRRHLRQYCDSWIESHYDVRRWRVRASLEEDFTNLQYELAQETGEPPKVQFVRMPEFGTGPDVPLEGTPEPDEATMEEIHEHVEDQSGRVIASEYFLRFITSSAYTSIRKCKRQACGKYFVNTSGHENAQYCSRKCARGDTAAKFTEGRRKAIRRETLQIIQQAMNKFATKSATWRRSVISTYGRGRWQNVIADKANQRLKVMRLPRIKSNFITQAVRKGHLTVRFNDRPVEEDEV